MVLNIRPQFGSKQQGGTLVIWSFFPVTKPKCLKMPQTLGGRAHHFWEFHDRVDKVYLPKWRAVGKFRQKIEILGEKSVEKWLF